MNGHILDVLDALAIDAFSITIRKVKEIIGHTFKNGSYMKRCLGGMKDIYLLKTSTKMGGERVTPSKDLVDAKISNYQICEYVNRLDITKNGLKAAYSLR